MTTPTRHEATPHRTGLSGVEAISLVSNRGYPRHAHDQFGVGVIEFGGHRSWSGVGVVDAGPGDLIMVNPGEIHDGAPIQGAARGWRMLYLDPGVVTAAGIADAGLSIEDLRPVARDPVATLLFEELFTWATTPTPDPLGLEQAVLRCLVRLFGRHGVRGGHAVKSDGPPPAVAIALERLNQTPEAPTSLADLAALAGVSRFQLLRGFAKEVGVTPYAYLLQRRLSLAKRLLAAGHSPAEAAFDAGFADQSHLTRAFLRQFGLTPGRYRAALV